MTAYEIKQIVSIEQVLSNMYGLEVKNRMDCPIHGGDKCFLIRDDTFKCFSCGASGDIFNLVQGINSIDFARAKNHICDYFNLSPIFSKAEKESYTSQFQQIKEQRQAKQILKKLRRYQQDRICQVLREIRTSDGGNSLERYLEKHLEKLLLKFDQRAEFFIAHDIHAHLKSVLYRYIADGIYKR